jgi:hypothetical protein
MRILCYVNHFFGQNPHFLGKSSLQSGLNRLEIQRRADTRKMHVERVVAQAKLIGNVDVKICGIKDYSLIPVDIYFDKIREKPLWLIYESLNHMANLIDEYDYFINLEDDIFLPQETFNNIVDFDKISQVNEILLPNRMEKSQDGKAYCVDLIPLPGWTQQKKKFNGNDLQVGFNPHSGLLILSKDKFQYALQFLDRDFRGVTLYNELDSAFAYFHSPFCLFRSRNMDFHYVSHLDKWLYSPGEVKDVNSWSGVIKSLRLSDFVPPACIKVIRKIQSIF